MIGLHIPLGRADVHNPLGAVSRAENLTIPREKEEADHLHIRFQPCDLQIFLG